MKLLSIVIPTKNSERTLKECLESIKRQTYQNYEIIIVDGYSRDKTEEIARQYTDKFYSSTAVTPGARNVGFSKARGEIFFSIDSDMVLEETLLEEAVERIKQYPALIMPEAGYGDDFVSRCKDLEKRCYVGDELIEASRIFTREAFEAVNGYDSELILGEDWDMQRRLKSKFSIGRIEARALHNTKNLPMIFNLKKAYRYGNSLPIYAKKGSNAQENLIKPSEMFFIRHFSKLKKEPVSATGLFFIKGMEYAAGFTGLITAKMGFTRDILS